MAKKSIVKVLGVKGITKKMMQEAEKHHQLFVSIWNSAVCAEHKSGLDFDPADGEVVYDDQDLREACNDAATAIETGNEKLLLSTLVTLGSEAMNTVLQFYANRYMRYPILSSSRYGRNAILTDNGRYFEFDEQGKIIVMPNPKINKKVKQKRIDKTIKNISRQALSTQCHANKIIDCAKTKKPVSKYFKKIQKNIRKMGKSLNKCGDLSEKIYGIGMDGDDCLPYYCKINDAIEAIEKIMEAK